MNSVLYTVREAPGKIANETIDVILVSGIMEQPTSVVFLDDGVYQLISNLGTIGVKDTKMKWSALPTYGITNVYALRDSLDSRSIGMQQLPDWVKPIESPELNQILHTVRFVISD